MLVLAADLLVCQHRRRKSETSSQFHPKDIMQKQDESETNVPSWYPSNEELVTTQREQVLKSRQVAAAFASQNYSKAASSWWRRLFGSRA